MLMLPNRSCHGASLLFTTCDTMDLQLHEQRALARPPLVLTAQLRCDCFLLVLRGSVDVEHKRGCSYNLLKTCLTLRIV